jgi:hypothetical protein
MAATTEHCSTRFNVRNICQVEPSVSGYRDGGVSENSGAFRLTLITALTTYFPTNMFVENKEITVILIGAGYPKTELEWQYHN